MKHFHKIFGDPMEASFETKKKQETKILPIHYLIVIKT